MHNTKSNLRYSIPPIHLLSSIAKNSESVCKSAVRDFKLSIALELSNYHVSVIHTKKQIRTLSSLSDKLKYASIASGALLLALLTATAMTLYQGVAPSYAEILGLIISAGIFTLTGTSHLNCKSESNLQGTKLSSLDDIITQHQRRIELCDEILCGDKANRIYH